MNEHIKALINRCTIDIETFDSEMFVELIMKECVDCCYHMDKDSGPITADLIKIRIMSLFGVEK